jgi:hypothetical protein
MKELEQSQIDALKAANPNVELHQVRVGEGERETMIVVKVPDRPAGCASRSRRPTRTAGRSRSRPGARLHRVPVEARADGASRQRARRSWSRSAARSCELAGLEETVVAKKL